MLADLPEKIGRGFEAQSLVIFVHGLGGSKETWRALSELLEKETNFNIRIDFAYHEYETGQKKSMFIKYPSIMDLGEILEGKMNETFRRYKEIILVGHSMGGLISKIAIIETILKAKKNRVSSVVFYDTPHLGSRKASKWKRFSRSPQVKEMARENSHIIKYIEKLWTYLELELKFLIKYLVPSNPDTVDEESGSHHLGNPNVIKCDDTNHETINKPSTIHKTEFTTLFNILKDINDNTELDNKLPSDTQSEEDWYASMGGL